tara:strand:- start:157 stop:1107 length:951 start_codon:yes stop_codon:yes gene_type:complete
MLIVGDLSAEVPDTNAYHWNLEEQSQDSDSEVLLYGYNASDNLTLQERLKDYSRKVYFNNWAPCEFAQKREENGHDAFKKEAFFDEVYSICPYSNKWLNSLNLGREYKDVFYPFHTKLIPEPVEKSYDVIYHGGIHGQEHIDCIRATLNYNYRFCSMTHHINALTQECLRFATNVNLAFQQKIELIAQTKISVCYNLVHVAPEHIPAIQSYDNWQNNEAFSEVGKSNLMPQFKTRFHEAAISKTLNLVHRDPWNIVEDYYVPDEEFIYFTDVNDLHKKIGEISRDWNNYTNIVENAYNKAMNYTCERFIHHISKKT